MAATHFFGSAFFGGEFFFSAGTATTGGHFAGRKRRKQNYAERAEARERLRAQIIAALEGPPELQALVAPYIIAAPEWTTAPLIDWERVWANFESIEAKLLLALDDDFEDRILFAQDDDDDDESDERLLGWTLNG